MELLEATKAHPEEGKLTWGYDTEDEDGRELIGILSLLTWKFAISAADAVEGDPTNDGADNAYV